MQRYAIIDIHSGFVWGVTDAGSPENACHRIDYDDGERGRTYTVFAPDSGAHTWGRTGYIVHRVPGGFDVEDGQNQDEILATTEHPRAAIVLWKQLED